MRSNVDRIIDVVDPAVHTSPETIKKKLQESITVPEYLEKYERKVFYRGDAPDHAAK